MPKTIRLQAWYTADGDGLQETQSSGRYYVEKWRQLYPVIKDARRDSIRVIEGKRKSATAYLLPALNRDHLLLLADRALTPGYSVRILHPDFVDKSISLMAKSQSKDCIALEVIFRKAPDEAAMFWIWVRQQKRERDRKRALLRGAMELLKEYVATAAGGMFKPAPRFQLKDVIAFAEQRARMRPDKSSEIPSIRSLERALLELKNIRQIGPS